MNDQGSPTRALCVKKEMPSSGPANGNNAGGVSDRYAAAAATALAKGEKRSNVAGFLAKAYHIFDNPAWSEICGWGEAGETVVIRKQIEFAQRILPLFFSHSNLQSFVRQLNMYNFRKVVQDPNSGEFKHDLFRKGNEHLLHKVKRKQSAAAASAASNALPQNPKYGVPEAVSGTGQGRMAMAGGIVEEADNVLDELVKLRKWKEDMENTVVELKRDKQTLQSENQMLKGQVADHGQHQMMLQTKMQNILFCIYDAYVSGLPALTASGEPGAGGQDADAIVKSESLVAANSYGSGAAAGSALEKALQQLAALAGLNMASRIDQLHMENPWALGGAAGGGEELGAGAGGAAAATNGTGPGVPSAANGGIGTNSTVVGGGSLKRNRAWSQTSCEWLRSLRDPDPLESMGSPASSAQADLGSSDDTPDAHASAAAEPPGDVGFSTGNDGNDLDATTAGVTTERSASKRPRRLSSLEKVDGGGGGGGSSAAAPSAALSPPPSGATPTATPTAAAPPSPAAGGPTGGAVAPAAAAASIGKGTSAQSPSDAFHKSLSFQANAPLPRGMSISGIVEEAEKKKCGIAAAGGNEGSGEIWGGGALSRKLSEQATQVVSELGEMGHREGEALTKIDSLGFQLANLLDPNMTLDEIHLFDEPNTVGDVTVTEGVDAVDDAVDDAGEK